MGCERCSASQPSELAEGRTDRDIIDFFAFLRDTEQIPCSAPQLPLTYLSKLLLTLPPHRFVPASSHLYNKQLTGFSILAVFPVEDTS